MKKKLHLALWAFIGLVFSMSAFTLLVHSDYGGPFALGDSVDTHLIQKGQKLYSQRNCMSCHGAKGLKPISDSYPIIAGNNKNYIATQIKDILKGYRTNGMSTQMAAAVGQLSDDEILALAAYLSSSTH